MALGLSIFSVAFAALCVWLTVRIVNRRERWAKSTLAVILLLPVFYFTSFGLACSLCQQWILPQRTAWLMFRPLTWLTVYGPPPARATIRHYAIFCGDNQQIVGMNFGKGTEYSSISPSPVVYEILLSKKSTPPR